MKYGLPTRHIGMSDVAVTVLGLGSAPLGNLFEEVPEERALATVRAGVEAGIGWFDTAPYYGHGLAEHRVGHVLRGVPRGGFTLSTKVGRLLRPSREPVQTLFKGEHRFEVVHDYTYDGAMRSIEDSCQRLGLSRIDIALIHDIDVLHQGEDYEARLREAMGGACRALGDLRAQGLIGAWGIGVNEVGPCLRFGRETDLDCVMLARCYTLLEQEGVPELLALAEARGFSLLVAGPFGSGILASGSAGAASHNYARPEPEALERVRRVEGVCARHDVPLRAAALQFALGHPCVAAVAAGAVVPEQAMENAALILSAIPSDFWVELRHEGLLDEGVATPKGESAGR